MIARVLIAGFAAVMGVGGCAAAKGDDDALIDAVDQLLTEAVETARYPGLSVAIVRNGTLLHQAGYGRAVLEHDVKATPETVYAVGSVTKPFTCLAIARLVSQGTVALQATVGEYLADYEGPGRDVTVSQLLTHTSGLYDYTRTERFSGPAIADHPPGDVVASFQERPLQFAPGSQFEYTNSGTFLLGLIIEAVSGQAYADHIRREIIEPMGLENTGIYDRAAIVDGRAFGYAYRDGRFERAHDLSPTVPFSAGALLSTAPDMARFLATLLRDQAFARATRDQLLRRLPLAGGAPTFYTQGCLLVTDLEGRAKISHAGSIAGGSAQMAYYPQDDLIIAIGANASGLHPHPWSLERRIARLVLGLEPAAGVDKPLAAARARRYEGDFDLAPYRFGSRRYGFSHRDGGLHLIYGGRDSGRTPIPLIHLGDDRFAVSHDSEITFRFRGPGAVFPSVDILYFDAPLIGRRAAVPQTHGESR